MKKQLIVAAAIAFIAAAPSAKATDTFITVFDDIAETCQATVNNYTTAAYNVDLTNPGVVTSNVVFSCNRQYNITMSADNGGFLSDKVGQPGYTGGTDEVEYTMDFFGSTYNSDDLTTAQTLVVNGQTGSFTEVAQFAWNAATDLYPGRYQDRITISVTPTP